MDQNEINDLLMQEMEEVMGGADNKCVCFTSALQGSDGDCECITLACQKAGDKDTEEEDKGDGGDTPPQEP